MIDELFNLAGKTALVTGGSQGIGKYISLALAEKGADIIINYRSDDRLAFETQKEIDALGRKCVLIRYDLSKDDASTVLARQVTDAGLQVDILVLNASIQIRKNWYEVTNEEFEIQINTNLRASLFLIKQFYPAMKEKGWGRILTVGSVQQVRPHQQMIIYAASKCAQLSFMKNLAPQFAPYGVTINNLAPGVIATGRNAEVMQDEAYKHLLEKKIPLGYIGKSADCASSALLLCSDAGRYITGADLFVDGGMGLLV